MTDTGDAQKTIDDDVLNALPCSCWLPSEYGTIFLVATAVLPKLRKIMTDEQIIAAHEGTDPELLEKMRAISCRGCSVHRCPLNFKYNTLMAYGSRDPLPGLSQGQFEERIKNAKAIEAELLALVDTEALASIGLRVRIYAQPSRKHAAVSCYFYRGEETVYWLRVHVNERKLSLRGQDEEFGGFYHLREMIKRATEAAQLFLAA